MRNMKLQNCIAATLAVMMTTSVLPIHAQEESTAVLANHNVVKDESVYAFLKSDGTVNNITVSDWLHCENGFENYEDTSDLSKVINLKSDDQIKTFKNGYKWTSKNNDIYYQGESTKALPISVKIEYELDGKKLSAEELAGKSGHLKMNISLENNEKVMKMIDGVNRPIYTPFVAVTMVVFKGNDATNIKTSTGTVQTDSTNKIASAVMLPGLSNSFGNLLDGSLESIQSYLKDDMVIEADVNDFSTPTIMMAVSTSTDELNDSLSSKSLTSAAGDLNKLDDAMHQLLDGAKKLDDGVGELQNGMKGFVDGTNQLSNGLGQLVANNDKINNGIDQLADGILQQVNNQLPKGFPTLTWNNYSSILENNAGITSEMKNIAMDLIKEEIRNGSDEYLTDSEIETLLYLTIRSNPGLLSYASSPEEMKKELARAIKSEGNYVKSVKQIESKVNAAQNEMKNGAKNSKAVQKMLATDETINFVKSATTNEIVGNLREQGFSEEEAKALATKSLGQYLADPSKKIEDIVKVNATIAMSPKMKAQLMQKGINDTDADDIIKKVIESIEKDPQQDLNEVTKAETINYFAQPISRKLEADGIPHDMATDVAIKSVMKYLAGDVRPLDKIVKETLREVKEAAMSNNQQSENDPKNQVNQKNSTNSTDQVSAPRGEDQSAANAKLYQGIYNAVIGRMKQSGIEDKEAQLVLTYAAMNYGDKNIDDAIKAAASDLSSAKALKSVADGAFTSEGQKVLDNFVASAIDDPAIKKQFQEVLTTLASVDALRSGIHEYTKGVATAYEGSIQLKDGASKLSDGTNQLKEGTSQLYDGLQRLSEEGISKLTGKSNDFKKLQTISKIVKETKDRRTDFTNYSGLSEGTEGKVKYIYKVDTVKAPDTIKKKTVTEVEDEKETLSFWQRIIALFQPSKK